MIRARSLTRSFSFMLISLLLMLAALTPVSAGIVTTTDLVHSRQIEQERQRLHELLSREDVQRLLETQGVDAVAAKQRVESMTDEEVQTLAAHMDQLPAGAGLSTTQWLLIIIIVIIVL